MRSVTQARTRPELGAMTDCQALFVVAEINMFQHLQLAYRICIGIGGGGVHAGQMSDVCAASVAALREGR